MKEYCVGIYTRLSRDDERQGESLSIENQRMMLQRYCEEQGWTVGEVFADDGWSGTNFQRPGFLRMMEAVREKRINLVLVKDLSRLGRDYIQVGTYTDCVFPHYDCRFIALNDGVDTLRQNDDIAMIFKNVFNDIYARDTSRKIRAVRRANAENGKFMGYKAPYGYAKSPEDRHCLVIDEAVSKNVERIFLLRAKGMTNRCIAELLTQDGILSPRDYFLRTSGHAWRRETVRAILNNEVYIGNLVQLKQGNFSYKDRRQRLKPPETWARVQGTHAPIVTQKLWDAAHFWDQQPLKRRKESRDDLASVLHCGICGKSLRTIRNYKNRRDGIKTYTYYICRGHVCISKRALEMVVFEKVGREMAGGDIGESREDYWGARELWMDWIDRIEIGHKEDGGEEREALIYLKSEKMSCSDGNALLCPLGKTIRKENPVP